MVTLAPPPAGPNVGATEETVGARKVNWSTPLRALVPDAVVTVIATVPTPTGESAVINVAEFTLKAVALVVPKRTDDAPVKLVPVILTALPPAPAPLFGVTLEIVGALAPTV
jgi:hypothetical protein